eukprot:TRINITY_DN4341_c0_g1_i1.p1 TRINITY_DN4341_c0_g1~~TRINITY_DN4341_c0_g1_i1.p1  ORF type:complete len:167 (-),score=42.77 TRINITY_DN4341_c0_g1_i1:67-501(-)
MEWKKNGGSEEPEQGRPQNDKSFVGCHKFAAPSFSSSSPCHSEVEDNITQMMLDHHPSAPSSTSTSSSSSSAIYEEEGGSEEESYNGNALQEEKKEAEQGAEEDVLVVAGCRSCFMYYMLPKSALVCPSCKNVLLHFSASSPPT